MTGHVLSPTIRVADPGRYDFSPIIDRPRLTLPDNAYVAVWVAVNLEFYELFPPPNAAKSAWLRKPDIVGYAQRDYGNRVGIWRLMESLDRLGIRATALLNAAVGDHHPEIVDACLSRQWELVGHGVYNTRFAYGMEDSEERSMIQDVIDVIEKMSGQRPTGWLSPFLSNTPQTLDLLAEAGFSYTCDFFHDDQPFPLKVKAGRLISMPYSLEVNDSNVFVIQSASPEEYRDILIAYFDQLYREGQTSARVMAIPIHPFLTAQPHRIRSLAEALSHIAAHDRTWITAPSAIANWYYEHHYADVFSHSQNQAAPWV
jgi:peptidoglycan/xylan/chitin deacetylase (PgdA/CDA1 family)